MAPQASGADAVQSVTSDGETLGVDVLSGSSPVIVQLSAGDIPAALPVLRGVDAQVRQNNNGFGADQHHRVREPLDRRRATACRCSGRSAR